MIIRIDATIHKIGDAAMHKIRDAAMRRLYDRCIFCSDLFPHQQCVILAF